MIFSEYKAVCKQLNISPKALRIYENLEIVVPERAENNYRNYNEDEYYADIEKIKKYAEFLGCIVLYEHIVNFTWIVEIVKRDDDKDIKNIGKNL